MKRKTGPKAARDDCCHITESGYLRGRFGGKQRLAHVVAWEGVNGPVPPGKQLHHINEDKLDNRVENLEALTPLEHKRKHGGCDIRDGVWWKPCGICGNSKPIDADHWYMSREGWPLYGRCRTCHCRKVCEDARAKTARARALRLPRLGPRSEAILRVLTEKPGASVSDVATAVYGTVNRRTVGVTRALALSLVKRGKLERIMPGRWKPTPDEPRPVEKRRRA